MTRTVAVMAVLTGISPNDLLDTDPDIFAERYLKSPPREYIK